MAQVSAAIGSEFIFKALNIIGCKIPNGIVCNLIIDVRIEKISISVNGCSLDEFCDTSSDKRDGLLKLCGYSSLIGRPLRSMVINLLCDDVANVNINMICEVNDNG